MSAGSAPSPERRDAEVLQDVERIVTSAYENISETLGYAAFEYESDGGVALLERNPDAQAPGFANLEDALIDQITHSPDDIAVGEEAARYLEERRSVNRMLLVLAQTDDLDEAMLRFRRLWARDKSSREEVDRAYEANPALIRLTDLEYTDIAKKIKR